MRLKIVLESEKIVLPINYQAILQGFIYNIFDKKEYGHFLHDCGYQEGKKVFKLFTFSNLFGNYELENHSLIFQGKVSFYISSQSEEFMQSIYDFFCRNSKIWLQHQMLKVVQFDFLDLSYFRGVKEVRIRTLSPVVAYTTENKYVTYFKPSDTEFERFCMKNLIDKNHSIENPIRELVFHIKQVVKEKKRMAKFKNTFYESYLAELVICVNYETLMLLYNTGLSAKGPSGFGMIEVCNEKSNRSI